MKRSFLIQKVKRAGEAGRTPAAVLRRRLVHVLKHLADPSTMSYATVQPGSPDAAMGIAQDLPTMIFIHHGRAFALQLKGPRDLLTTPERAMHLRFRAAGSRVEVARSVGEALEHLRSFGVPLKNVALDDIPGHAA